MSEIILEGIPASPGITAGPAYIWHEEELEIPIAKNRNPSEEYQKLVSAITDTKAELEEIRSSLEADGLKMEAKVFTAHAMMLEDPTLHKLVKQKLQKKINIESAWMEAINTMADKLSSIPDPTLSAREADLRDAGKRVVYQLLGIESQRKMQIEKASIVVAKDLSPSETATMDRDKVIAFCTVEGGSTSHTAILAKSLGIPAVVGISGGLMGIPFESKLIVDGNAGKVIINPNEETRVTYDQKHSKQKQIADKERQFAQDLALTLDGHQVEVVANVGNIDDANKAIELGAEGIGLLRTEFLYLERNTAPSEEEQYQVYAEILDEMENRPVVVRTIDVGGDKQIPYLELGEEANPFLGYRAIRMCLDNQEFFKVQLRALLRAGIGHDLRIMFPMIATVEEVLQTKALIQEAQEELLAAEKEFKRKPQIGIMVEIPSVAIMVEQFVGLVDFFSIGSNDLTQYTLAVDRVNPNVAQLNDPCHPAVLWQIKRVIEVAHQNNRWVGVCGEMAGDETAIPILLGMGLDEFSMSANLIPHAKSILRKMDLTEAKKLSIAVLQLKSANEVRAAANQYLASL